VSFTTVFVVIGSLGRSLFFGKNKLSIRLVDIFPNLFVGLVVVVTFFSLYSTKLQSINFLFVLIGLGFFYKRRDFLQLNFPFEEHKNHKYILFIFFVILFSLLFQSIYQYNDGRFAGYRWDDLSYSTVAYHITEQGIENASHVANLVNEDVSLGYYHYFELWLTGFFYTFLGQNINTVFILYTSVLINFSALLAVYYFLITEVKLSSTQLFILLTVFGLISITTFPFYKIIFGNSLFYGIENIFLGQNETTHIKSTLLLLPICVGVQFLRKNHLFLTGIMVSILVVFSVVMLPFAFISTFFLVLYSFFNKKKELKKIVVYSLLFYVFFIGFYYFQGALSKSISTVNFSMYKEIYFRVRITLSLTVKTFIYFAPHFIILIAFSKKEVFNKEKKVIVLYLALVVATAFMTTFFYKQINYLQIANLVNFNLTKLIIIYFLAKINVELKTKKNIILISLFIILTLTVSSSMFYNLYFNKPFYYNKTFDKQAREFFNPKNNINSYFGVYISPPVKIDPYNIVSTYNSPFAFLSTIQSGTSLLSLSHIDIPNNEKDPIDSLNFDTALKNDPFYKFIQKQKQKEEFESVNQSRYDFIIKYRPYFLAVKKEDDIPDLLRPILGERIESKSGGVILYKLKYKE
jgi:hypothetical protein